LIIMDASKETIVIDSRAVYTPPVVVRIGDLKEGAGICATQGSGDSQGCAPSGSRAVSTGCNSGNVAGGICSGTGSNVINGEYCKGD